MELQAQVLMPMEAYTPISGLDTSQVSKYKLADVNLPVQSFCEVRHAEAAQLRLKQMTFLRQVEQV